MARWPLGLLVPPGIGLGVTPGANVVRTPMDIGPPKMRRRATAKTDQVDLNLVLNAQQLDALRVFHEDTLEEAGEFDWFDFRYPAFARWGLTNVRQWNDRFSDDPALSYPEQTDTSRILQAVGEAWLAAPTNLLYYPGRLYRMSARVRSTVAPSNAAKDVVYFGVEGVASDGETLINTAGANLASAQHYVAADGVDLSTVASLNEWHDFTGYFSGLGSSPFGDASNPANPTVLRTGVRYFRPMFALNHDDGDGTMELAEISVGVHASYRFLAPPAPQHLASRKDNTELWRVGVSLERLP